MDSVRDLRNGEVSSIRDWIQEHQHEVLQDPSVREMLEGAFPSGMWQGVKPVDTVFIETQRLRYSGKREVPKKSAPTEEITRQSQQLAELLQRSLFRTMRRRPKLWIVPSPTVLSHVFEAGKN
jgi:hypothetical protein